MVKVMKVKEPIGNFKEVYEKYQQMISDLFKQPYHQVPIVEMTITEVTGANEAPKIELYVEFVKMVEVDEDEGN